MMPDAASVIVPVGGFGTIYLDPPWPERGGGQVKRGADRHYQTIPVKEMPRVILQCPYFHPADDALMWMWATANYTMAGGWLMEVLGFRYVTNRIWVKVVRQLAMTDLQLDWERTKRGLGQRQRNCHELLLLGVRGHVPVPEPKDRDESVRFAPPTEHSSKPELYYREIERVSPEPRLELFARSRRPGWTSWGNEV
jgi:N6-adenosine-specific RNA methylase IME4